MRVAMIGQRGVPATFGGIERHVEEIGARLAERGHDVTVFCRTNYVADRGSTYRGLKVRYLPTVGTKHADAICHSGLSTVMSMCQPFDVIHYHALGPGLLAPLPRAIHRSAVVQTIHGRDDQRAKWGLSARSVLGVARWVSARVPHATITVSKDLQRFYAERYGRAVDYIPNGVDPMPIRPPSALLDDLGLTPGQYVLFVGRLVPEKAPDLLVRSFARMSEPGMRLAIVGGSSFTNQYVASLEELAASDPRVCMVGPRYGKELEELYANAGIFALPSSLEGLPLTLLEAASYGLPIVASDIPPHLEVIDGDGPGHRVFASGDADGLATALLRARKDPPAERAGAKLLRDKVLDEYQWDRVAQETEEVYQRACAVAGSRRRSRRRRHP